jgi:hypothetical protein
MPDLPSEELGRIDYFLDQLARAVERGEVPLESYDRLAPRYLERREELVRILTIKAGGAVQQAAPTQAAPGLVPVAPIAQPPAHATPEAA